MQGGQRGEGWIARAPLRADLAGGTLDIWPLGLLVPGAVTVAVALDLLVEVTARPAPGRLRLASVDRGRRRDLPAGAAAAPKRGPLELLERVARRVAPEGVALESRSPVRQGSGLGTSSALGVAAAAAAARVSGARLAPAERVRLVRDIEAQILGIPTGTQDHQAAARGGLLILEHLPGGARPRRLGGDAWRLLRRCLLIVDARQPRSSGPSNWDMFRRAVEGEGDALRALRAVARAGSRAASALAAGDGRALGRAMNADTRARAEWSPLVLGDRLGEMLESARRAGAWGAKVCGAGGGGHLALLAPVGRQAAVQSAVAEAGGQVIPARPRGAGLRVTTLGRRRPSG